MIRISKDDVHAVEMAVDIYETNEGAGNENEANSEVLEKLKTLLKRMKKDLAKQK